MAASATQSPTGPRPRPFGNSHENDGGDISAKLGALGLGSDSPKSQSRNNQQAGRSSSQPWRSQSAQQNRQQSPRNHRQGRQPQQQQANQQQLLNALLAGQQQSPSVSEQDLLALLQLQQAQAMVTQNPHLYSQLVMQAQAQQAVVAAAQGQNRQNMSLAQQQYLQQLSQFAQPSPRSPLLPQGMSAHLHSPRQPYSPSVNSLPSQAPIRGPAVPSISVEKPVDNKASTRPEGTALTALLSRRTAGTDTSSQSSGSRTTSPTSPTFPSHSQSSTPSLESVAQFASTRANLGHGRPQNVPPQGRAWTAPSMTAIRDGSRVEVGARAASYAGTAAPRSIPVRQPFGPPGEVAELKDKNFASRIRKQAGRNLGLLSRRGDTPASTPVLA